MTREERNLPKIIFAGNSISSTYLAELTEFLKDKDFSINVISKSGTTTEPAIAFRVLKDLLESKYGKDRARSRVFATTDKSKGALKNLSEKEGYETFVVPDDIGGRYSVLTAVGLLPIAVAGINIDCLLKDAEEVWCCVDRLGLRKKPLVKLTIRWVVPIIPARVIQGRNLRLMITA